MKSVFKIQKWQLLKARGVEGNLILSGGDFVAIGKRAFAGKSNRYLQSVHIPSGVSVIKAEAFLGCENLQTVVLSYRKGADFDHTLRVFRSKTESGYLFCTQDEDGSICTEALVQLEPISDSN